MELSVVVICRNQKEAVLRCVRSVLADIPPATAGWELLVVDSASTDGTRDALHGLPVRWIGIEESPLLCASLGRWAGTERSKGDFILFLDGDMELSKGFLPAAMDLLRSRTEVAGVVGQVMERQDGSPSGWRDRNRILRDGASAKFGGAVLFRRGSLLRAGGYDPYVFNREENELYSRIRMAGETVWMLPIPMVIHHDPPASATEKIFREILPGRRRPLGRAQAFLRSWKKGNLVFYVRQERLFFFSVFADTVSAVVFLLLPSPTSWIALAVVQISSLATHAVSWSAGQYILNKIAAVQFLYGLAAAPRFFRMSLPSTREAS